MNVLLALFIELIKIINEDFNLFESRIISILRYIRVFILFLEIFDTPVIEFIFFVLEGIYNICIHLYNVSVAQVNHQTNQIVPPALPGPQKVALEVVHQVALEEVYPIAPEEVHPIAPEEVHPIAPEEVRPIAPEEVHPLGHQVPNLTEEIIQRDKIINNNLFLSCESHISEYIIK